MIHSDSSGTFGDLGGMAGPMGFEPTASARYISTAVFSRIGGSSSQESAALSVLRYGPTT